MNNLRKIVLILSAFLILSIAIFGTACGAKQQAQPAGNKSQQPRAVDVTTTVVQEGDIGSTLVLMGQINASVQTKVVPKQSGKVAVVMVQVGEVVRAGQPLVQIDISDLNMQLQQQRAALEVAQAQYEKAKADALTTFSQAQSSLEQAKASLEDAKAGANRLEKLWESGGATQQAVTSARTNLQSAQARYDAALQQHQTASAGGDPLEQNSVKISAAQLNQVKANLATLQYQISQATITAPFAGVVASRDVEAGSFAGTQTSLITLAALDPVKVSLLIPESMIDIVQVGLPAEVSVPASAKKNFSTAIQRLSPVKDNNAKAYPAEMELKNPQAELKPGMVAQVTVSGVRPRRAIVIPANAYLQTPDGPKAFTVEQGAAVQHLLKLGTIESNRVEVLEGLKSGDVLIMSGLEQMKQGTRVQEATPGSSPRSQGEGGKAKGDGKAQGKAGSKGGENKQ